MDVYFVGRNQFKTKSSIILRSGSDRTQQQIKFFGIFEFIFFIKAKESIIDGAITFGPSTNHIGAFFEKITLMHYGIFSE